MLTHIDPHVRDFSEKGQKKGKIFENLGENVQNLKIFRKRAASFVQLKQLKGMEGFLEKEGLESPKSLQNKTNLMNNMDKDCLKQICH